MKKKIVAAAFLIIGAYVALNFYYLRELKDCCITSAHVPQFALADRSVERAYVAASYYNEQGDSILCCRYKWISEYKYMFYEPQQLADDYALYLPGADGDRLIELQFSDPAMKKQVKTASSFVHADSIPERIIVRNSEHEDPVLYKLRSEYTSALLEIPWYAKFTWGPIAD
jgi:hypothetical protein